jgi:hypothetical protein
MKAVVFMCLTIVGASAGIFVGVKTDSGISYAPYLRSVESQQSDRAMRLAIFALGGAAVGAGFGWAACNIEKLGPPM